MSKLIITVAPVGAETTREQQPNLPITAEEIAEEAARCEAAGASVIHLHVRKPDGSPTQDKEVFAEAIEAIASRTNLIIQVSTGGAVWMTADERLQSIYAHPAIEMATLTTGSVNFGDDVFLNTPAMIERFAKEMKELGIKPEIECFDAGAVTSGINLIRRGLIAEPAHFDFVMGVPGGITATTRDLVYLVGLLPENCTWQVAGIGRFEIPLATVAIIMGGHVRVGFEDNIYISRGKLAKSNAELVEKVVRLANELGREVATPDEARAIHLLPGRRK